MKRHSIFLLAALSAAICPASSCDSGDGTPSAPPVPEEKPVNDDVVKVLYWNLQCGMWTDQGNNYDNFVAWVKAQDPDICVWNEAETTFDTGVFDWSTHATEKYLPAHWPELAARYGHSYVMVNPVDQGLVTTSKFPFEREKDIYPDRPKVEIRSGSTIYKFNIKGEEVRFVTLHLWPQHYDPYVPVSQRDQSRARNEGDLFRTKEIMTLCDTTINKRPHGASENWIMLGDFNARSPLDNQVYKYDLGSPSLRCITYVLEKTPYLDAVHRKHPNEFITSTYDYNHRIDYVFCTPPIDRRIVSADIIKDYYTNIVPLDDLYPGPFPPRKPSDHYPIVVTIDMGK